MRLRKWKKIEILKMKKKIEVFFLFVLIAIAVLVWLGETVDACEDVVACSHAISVGFATTFDAHFEPLTFKQFIATNATSVFQIIFI